METEGFEHGIPSWVDLGTPDIDAAAGFYGDLFGWTVEGLARQRPGGTACAPCGVDRWPGWDPR
jgi:predicted enzyme related to lactoylglutathione lyase